MSADRRSGLLGSQGWVAAVAIALTPSLARADVGIPMLALAWPAAWLTFPPVVLIEGIAARRILGLSHKEGLLLSLRANAWSTLVGIPVAWIGMLGIEMVAGVLLSTLPRTVLSGAAFQLLVAPFFAAWVPPTREVWVIPAAGALLCIPFYLLSVWLEARTYPLHEARPPQMPIGDASCGA